MEQSTTHPRIAAIVHPPVWKKSVFVAAFAIYGIFNTLAGIINLASAIILLSNATMPGRANAMMMNALFEICLSALIITASILLAKGKILSIWLYGASIILDSLYNLITGYPLNFVFIVFGLLMLWQTVKFRNELALL
jgi:hypothetical protein